MAQSLDHLPKNVLIKYCSIIFIDLDTNLSHLCLT